VQKVGFVKYKSHRHNNKTNYTRKESNTTLYFCLTGTSHYGHHQANTVQKFKKNWSINCKSTIYFVDTTYDIFT